MKTLTLKTHKNANIQAKLLANFLNTPGLEVEFLPEEENDFWPADSFDDEKAIKYVESQINQGNFYACFCARVKVTYKGFEADDYLGGCSYESEKDFKENSGYYIEMICQCIDQINKDIKEHNSDIYLRFQIRQLKNTADKLGFYIIPKTAIT